MKNTKDIPLIIYIAIFYITSNTMLGQCVPTTIGGGGNVLSYLDFAYYNASVCTAQILTFPSDAGIIKFTFEYDTGENDMTFTTLGTTNPLAGEASVDTYMELYNSLTGALLASNDDDASASPPTKESTIKYKPPTVGFIKYAVYISGPNCAKLTKPVKLTFKGDNGSNRPPVVTFNPSMMGCMGNSAKISVAKYNTASTLISPYLEFTDPDGVIASKTMGTLNADGASADLTFNKTGTFTLKSYATMSCNLEQKITVVDPTLSSITSN